MNKRPDNSEIPEIPEPASLPPVVPAAAPVIVRRRAETEATGALAIPEGLGPEPAAADTD